MLTRHQILESLHHFLPTKSKHLLNRHIEVFRSHKARNILQLLLRPNHNTTDDSTLAQCQCSNVGHLVLRAARKEPNNSNVTAVRYSIDALSDGTGAAVLEDVICSVTVGDLEDLL